MTNPKSVDGKFLLVGFLMAAASIARAETVIVSVPGNALGSFGNPSSSSQPYVSAIAINGPGTLTMKYISGVVTDCCINSATFAVGPGGVTYNYAGLQSPFQEALGVSGGTIDNADGLVGIFVIQSRVLSTGFSPVDGTKSLVPVGLLPGDIRFIGRGTIFEAKQAGTLFLGINDCCGGGNGGEFTVSVTFVPVN